MLSLSYSATVAAGSVALRSLGALAQSYSALAVEARSTAATVNGLACDLGAAADASDHHDPVGLAHDASQRDHAFARGDLRVYQDRLHALADDAAAEVERVREIALALPLAGMAQAVKVPATNGTVELVNGEPVARELFPCEREDDPVALTPEEAAEIIQTVLPTLEATLRPGERSELGAGEEAEADRQVTSREHLEATAAACREQIWTAGATTPEDEVALREAWADHHAAALPPATEAPPAPLAPEWGPQAGPPAEGAIEAMLGVETPGKKRPAKGRSRKAK